MYKNHTRCRACSYGPKLGAEGIKAGTSQEHLVPVFDLGVQPLANDFAGPNEAHAGYAPLKVMFCPKCTLAQLSVTVQPDILYRRYSYVTSQTATMRQHFEALDKAITEEQPFDSLLEIGSNDGTLLRHFAAKGVKVAGIDPAENLADIARKQGIPTVTGMLSAETAQLAMSNTKEGFDLILARHVFCHVDDWREFIDCLAIPSHHNTLVGIEVPYVADLLERGEFDTIYHEHTSYLSIKAVQALLQDSPFNLHGIVRFPIHGGAILLMLRRKDFGKPPLPSVDEYRSKENISPETWQAFAAKAHTNINALKDFVHARRAEGKRVVGYGASAKSTVFVNACRFTRKDIDFITDTTPQKLWKLSPGTDIPIVDQGAILRELPDYAICFCWNFRTEVLETNALALEKGVKFVFPVPTLEVV
jgi:hypothetical protein